MMKLLWHKILYKVCNIVLNMIHGNYDETYYAKVGPCTYQSRQEIQTMLEIMRDSQN